MDSTDNRIVIRCRKCNQRMFDYVSGDMHIEMKCSRCKRVMVMKNYTEGFLRAKAKNGEYRIWYSWIELRPPDVGNSEWLLRTRDAGESNRQRDLSGFPFAFLFLQVKSNIVKKNSQWKGVTKWTLRNMTNSVDYMVRNACFSRVFVDILYTKKVENFVEI